MIAAFLRNTLLAERHRRLAQKVQLYGHDTNRDQIESFQVQRFNEVWSRCLASVPFYQSWQRQYNLPRTIARVADLRDFPPLTKEILLERSAEIFRGGTITDAYTSGGSTGQPTRYPRGPGELDQNWVNAYLARNWWGIAPTDPNVHLWGHAHLFGSGLAGRVAQLRRRVADRALGLTRLNAYDLSEPALAKDYRALQASNPISISGYTSAIFKLARYIERNQLDLGEKTRLKAVILCSETASEADVTLVRQVFKVPVAIEYGAAETGVIAMSDGSPTNIRVLWDSHIALVADGGEVRLTTLTPRLFPLVNYAIRDLVVPGDIRDGNALTFKSVLGRSQDIVRVADGHGILDLSAILPIHILKSYDGVVGVQFEQVRPNHLHIHVETDRPIDIDDVRAHFVRELQRDHPSFDPSSVHFIRASEPARTLAGKHTLFLNEYLREWEPPDIVR